MIQSTAVDAAIRALSTIESCDSEVNAFISVDPTQVMVQATAIDGWGTGSLTGISVGIKDIFETFDHPTALGSEIYHGRRTRRDASIVSILRANGALIVGKTATAEFAYLSPPETRNPLDLRRTPGGSSSGSAAAVAAGMVDLAVGTQTGGSTIRPASYCGVVGFKPSFGTLSTSGAMALSPSFDTVGLFSRSIEVMQRAWRCLSSSTEVRLSGRGPMVGVVAAPFPSSVSAESRRAMDVFQSMVRDHGGTVIPVEPIAEWDNLVELHSTLSSYEAAQSLHFEHHVFRAKLSEILLQHLDRGSRVSAASALLTIETLGAARRGFNMSVAHLDFLIAPAADGWAPIGLESTGNPGHCVPWSALGVPALALPVLRAEDGLSVSVQMIARKDGDGPLLSWAEWAESRLAHQEPGTQCHAMDRVLP